MSTLAPETAQSLQSPTRVRYGVVAFACLLSMVTYIDRAAFASAAGAVVEDLGLKSVADLKWVFSAFALAYALFEVPSGWLGDVFGPRRALIRIVLWWSAFTALTALAGLSAGGVVLGLGFLVGVRFLFGAGEAGAYPNITRALHNWLPVEERGLGQGAVWFCGKLMAGLTPLVWMCLVIGTGWTPPLVTWRGAFWVFATLGVVWAVLFAAWFRDRPEEMPQVNAAELARIRAGGAESHAAHQGVPWGKLLASSNLWTLCLMYGCQAYGWYFYITYLPRFLEEQYRVRPDSAVAAIYKGGPLVMAAFACLLGGLVTDAVVRRTGDRRRARRICGLAGYGLCAACFVACPHAPTALTFSLAISAAAFFNDLAVPSAWAVCQDIGGRYAAIVGGLMNTVAGISGALAGWITGSILERSLDAHSASLGIAVTAMTADQKAAGLLGGYHLNFYTFAALYLVALLCWLKIDATRPLVVAEPAGDES